MVSVSQPAIFMMDSWPEEHGQDYKTALQACTGQLTTPEQVEAARQAFLAATEEAALVVVGAEPAVKATRRRGYLFEKPNILSAQVEGHPTLRQPPPWNELVRTGL